MMNEALAAKVVTALREKHLTLATAESCTGGGVGKVLTSVPGSSAIYLGGVISYANCVKEKLLQVREDTLRDHGAVSSQTAQQMALGVRDLMQADVSVSITGIAGPASDDTHKPVGLVYVAVVTNQNCFVRENRFDGDREAVREQSIRTALEMILDHMEYNKNAND